MIIGGRGRRLAAAMALAACAGTVLAAPPRRPSRRPQPARPAPAKPAPPKRHLLLFVDGRRPEQAELVAALQKAIQGTDVVLTTVRTDRPESRGLVTPHGVRASQVPTAFHLDGPPPKGKANRQVVLRGDVEPLRNLRLVLASLELPVPPPETPAPGAVLVVAPGDEAGERTHLLRAIGVQRVRDGMRMLAPGAFCVYRIPIPEGLRKADLRVEHRGALLVESSAEPDGPWSALLDLSRLLLGAWEREKRPLTAVVDLDRLVNELPGALYLRVLHRGRGADALLGKITLTARAVNQPSGEAAWLTEAETLRRKHLAGIPGAAEATPLSGVLRGETTLTRARSPYLMSGDVEVPYGSRLTIEAGTTIRVLGKQELRVIGELAVNGTASEPVQIVSALPRQPDDWEGLRFVPLPGRASGEGSVLSHCRVANARAMSLHRFAGKASDLRIEGGLAGLELVDGGRGTLERVRIHRCRVGVVVRGGGGTLTGAEVDACPVGIELRSAPVEPLVFEGCRATGITRAGVTVTPGAFTEGGLIRLTGWDWSAVPPELRLVGLPAGLRVEL